MSRSSSSEVKRFDVETRESRRSMLKAMAALPFLSVPPILSSMAKLTNDKEKQQTTLPTITGDPSSSLGSALLEGPPQLRGKSTPWNMSWAITLDAPRHLGFSITWSHEKVYWLGDPAVYMCRADPLNDEVQIWSTYPGDPLVVKQGFRTMWSTQRGMDRQWRMSRFFVKFVKSFTWEHQGKPENQETQQRMVEDFLKLLKEDGESYG